MKIKPALVTLASIAALVLVCAPQVFAADCYWSNGDGDNLWSNPNNWKNGLKPGSNEVDNVYLANDCPDEPQEIILDESAWFYTLHCTASGERHYTITPVSDETLRMGYVFGLNGSANRTVDLTINSDILISKEYLRVNTYGGMTTLNGSLTPAPDRVGNVYLLTSDNGGLLTLGGSNNVSELRTSAKLVLANPFATYYNKYIRARASTNHFFLAADNVEFGRFWCESGPSFLSIHEDLSDTNITAIIKEKTDGNPIHLFSDSERGSFLTLLLDNASHSGRAVLGADTTLHMTNSTFGSSAYNTWGWTTGEGRVVTDGICNMYSTNDYSGGTYINSGSLRLYSSSGIGGDDRLPTNGAVTVSENAELYLRSLSQRVGEMHGDGTVRLSEKNGSAPGTNSIVRLLSPGIDGLGTLTYTMAGTLILENTAISLFQLSHPEGENDQVVLANTNTRLKLGGTLEVRDLGGMDTGDYTLFTLNGGAVEGAFDKIILPRYIAGTVELIDGDVVLRAVRNRGTAVFVR